MAPHKRRSSSSLRQPGGGQRRRCPPSKLGRPADQPTLHDFLPLRPRQPPSSTSSSSIDDDDDSVQIIEQVRGTVHHQCARELTERYDHILIPSFSTSQMMVQKGGAGRRINKVTVRQMLGWAHFRFRQRLQQQAELRGATVHVVSEAYTT